MPFPPVADSALPSRCARCGTPEVQWEEMTFCPRCIREFSGSDRLGKIGPYSLETLLGQGGMGYVYLACHDSTGRTVALKTPRLEGRDRELFYRRFLQEAKALSALDHPGILPIYEVGEENGEPWFAMKLAESGTLADLMASGKGRLDQREAASMLADIANAVQYAHDRGVLHRDLKPHNILLDERGQAMVGDFGLARWEGQESTLSVTLLALGTPEYAAPELAQGRAPSAAADIYSLGAVFYHALAGHPPYRGANPAGTLTLAVEGRVESLTQHGIAEDLWQVCRKCLEPDPADRYNTARELEADLRSWLAGAPVSVRRLSPTEKLRRVVRRNPMVTALSLTTALALVLALAAVVVADRRVLNYERERGQMAGRLAEERLYTARLAQVELLLSSQRPGQRTKALEIVKEAWQRKPEPGLRELAVRALTLGDFVQQEGPTVLPRRFSLPPGPNEVVSLNGQRRARLRPSDDDGDLVQIVNPAGNEETLLKLDGKLLAMTWNTEGDQLVLACTAMRTYRWRAGSTEMENRLRPRDSATIGFVWHPGGRHIACVAADGVLWIWDLDRADEVIAESLGAVVDPLPEWKSAGRELAWQDANGTRRQMNVVLPTGVRVLRRQSDGLRRENFSTIAVDARREQVLWSTGNGVQLWEPAVGRQRQVAPKSGREWMGARFTAEGIQTCGWNSGLRGLTDAELASGGALPDRPGVSPYVGAVLMAGSENGWLALLQGPLQRFAVVKPGTKGARPLPQPLPYSVTLNHDGTRAATSSFQNPGVVIWDLSGPGMSARKLRELTEVEPAASLTFSPDGSRLLTVSNHRGAVWHVTSGELIANLGAGESFNQGAWLPDGRIVVVQNGRGAQLYSAADGNLLARLPHPAPLAGDEHVAMAVDSRKNWIAEQLEDSSVILWDWDELQRELTQLGMWE